MFDAFVTLRVFFFLFRIIEAFKVGLYIVFIIPIMILHYKLLMIQETRELGQNSAHGNKLGISGLPFWISNV